MNNGSVLIPIVIVLALGLFSGWRSDTVRYFMHAIYPPKDLYDFLINESLDISEKGLTKRFEFQHKYPGRHNIGILLANFSDDLYFKPLPQRYILKLKMEVSFYSQGTLIMSRMVENQYDPFLGRRGNGLSFITYKAPQDLPMDKLIVCEVKILEPDGQLYTTYGPTRFYISKMSDK